MAAQSLPTSTTCAPVVRYDAAGRYPYVPTCTCGWTWRGYVADHAAQGIADAHAAGEL